MQADLVRKHRAKIRAKRRRRERVRRVVWRCVLSLLTVLALVLAGLLAAGFIVFRGPSPAWAAKATMTMQETSALKFVPRLYYSRAEMDEFFAENGVAETTEETDTSMIVITKPTPTPSPEELAAGAASAPEATPAPENLLYTGEGLEIFSVKGGSYSGYMMVVADPSRVSVGTSADAFSSKPGMQLNDLAKHCGALAAINGGGFEDPNGLGNGGMPIGLVVADGKVMHTGNAGSNNIVVGFNEDDVLVVGKYTAKTDLSKLRIRDALSFGPALVVNGKAASVKGASSGLNPRTVIGQRADGAVLMLVIDGRQIASLGATYADCIDIMLEYGAVNAVNLDGGSSSLMYFKGRYVNNGVKLTGSRRIPTAFIVK